MKKAIIIIAVFALCISLAMPKNNKIVGYEEYTVTPGDTLWTIADEYYNDNIDIRRAIYDIEKHNGITADIQEWQAIELPIYEGGNK